MSLLRIEELSVELGGRPVFSKLSLDIRPGEMVGLIGPNGAGKTTLMRAALGLLPALGESSLARMAPLARARAAAWLPQQREIAWPVSVADLVALGRLPHGGDGIGAVDRKAVESALERMALGPLRDRDATRLSGGEQARALIARALAQESPLLLADEPIAGLDPAHQIAVMEVFSDLARDGHGVLVSLHDLGLAARHCDRLILLAEATILADGPPAEVLTPDLLARAFQISAFHEQTPDGPVFQALRVLK
ncbi:ABC transporter ATP-binding protein [Pseudooceanicola algae]|uniref:Hemin import ATP-binding protein HmuV n=1 Tax=Pseudooceanicola algae TaxID=1537215 RepID=A0A418SIX0_9RHOB|nr:ABC transporter ATP-binding protein [Pseudooceanicola algae]QPM91204.1 Hemin import ATP-binding protein HmuV [Pseudooceanicola algae]